MLHKNKSPRFEVEGYQINYKHRNCIDINVIDQLIFSAHEVERGAFNRLPSELIINNFLREIEKIKALVKEDI